MNLTHVFQKVKHFLGGISNQEQPDVVEEKALDLLVWLNHQEVSFKAQDLSPQIKEVLPSHISYPKVKELELDLRCVMASNPEYEQGLRLMESIVISIHRYAKQIKSQQSKRS